MSDSYDVSNAAKTQMYRKSPPAPTQVLVERGLIPQWVPDGILHWGEGKDVYTTAIMAQHAPRVTVYDPYSPDTDKRQLPPQSDVHGVGVCFYVLNVLPPVERAAALAGLLCRVQSAFIACRTDRVRGRALYDGVVTSRETFQATKDAEGWRAWCATTQPQWVVNVVYKCSSFVVLYLHKL